MTQSSARAPARGRSVGRAVFLPGRMERCGNSARGRGRYPRRGHRDQRYMRHGTIPSRRRGPRCSPPWRQRRQDPARAWLLPGSSRSRRALRALGFSICALAMLATRRGLHLIITQTNPPLVVPAIALAAAICRVPFIIIAQDLYPEVLFASNVLDIGSWRGRALNALFGWGYRRAHKVIVLGPCMARRVRAKGVPPSASPRSPTGPPANPRSVRPTIRCGPGGTFRIASWCSIPGTASAMSSIRCSTEFARPRTARRDCSWC